MKPKIVLIEDDEHQALFIAGDLQLQGFEVEILVSSSIVRRRLRRNEWNDVALFLVDIMMPAGTTYEDHATQDGLITGLFIARDIREKFENKPIILWSSSPFKRIAETARSFAHNIPICTFIPKHEGVEKVKGIYERFIKTGHIGPSILQQIWEAISFRPGVGGVSIDVKKLMKSPKKGNRTS